MSALYCDSQPVNATHTQGRSYCRLFDLFQLVLVDAVTHASYSLLLSRPLRRSVPE